MTADDSEVARIVRLLSAEASPLRRAAAELVVDYALDLRLAALIDADELSAIYVAALSSENVARVIERHVLPGIARVRGLLRDAGERVGDAVPEPVVARIEALAAKPDGPRAAWMRGALDPTKLRELLAPALAQTLLEFVRDLPLAGGLADAAGAGSGGGREARTGLAAGLVGRLGREVQKNTERLVNAGRTVAGGLGVDLERRVQQSARDFSQGAVAGLQRAMRERAASADGRALLAELSRGVVRHVMATPVETILRDLDQLPLEDAVRLAPATIEHNLARELGRRALETELRAFLAPAQPGQAIQAVAAGLFASPAFAGWLKRVLSVE